jgi:hypothetical protein
MTTLPRPGSAKMSLPPLGHTSAELAEKPTGTRTSRFSMAPWSWPGSVGRSMVSAIIRVWRQSLAVTRLSLTVVCEESATLGCYDYHTYADDVDAVPWFTEGGARCKRCGKRFRL